MLTKLIAICIITPFTILPSIFLGGIGGYFSKLYMTAELPIKRGESNAKAPVLGHFSAAITGLGASLAVLCLVSYSLMSSRKFLSGHMALKKYSDWKLRNSSTATRLQRERLSI